MNARPFHDLSEVVPSEESGPGAPRDLPKKALGSVWFSQKAKKETAAADATESTLSSPEPKGRIGDAPERLSAQYLKFQAKFFLAPI